MAIRYQVNAPATNVPTTSLLKIQIAGDGSSTVLVIPLTQQPVNLKWNAGENLPVAVYSTNAGAITTSCSLDTSTMRVTVTFGSAPTNSPTLANVLGFDMYFFYNGV